MIRYTVLALVSVNILFNVFGQLLLKTGMNKLGNFQLSLHALVPVFIRAFLNPYIILGLGCYVTGFLIWLIVLAKAEVSYAYPLISVGYVLTAVMGWWFLGENVTWVRISGILITCVGVFIISQS
ncbi:MAG: EamA family transporter [Desulfobacca sp.]|uniref:EamA family transporter n=1 Tax=Desulfobacca sp. TaxID=2067990 RepID=UPI0040493740